MKTYTTITNADFYETLKNDAQIGETQWTINKNARSGDSVLIYVCAPISAIVATAVVSDDPFENEDINSEWFGSFFALMENLQMLKKPITRKELFWEFPHWRYWTQPRNSVLVPETYAKSRFFRENL